ncbi:MAG: chemotaxis protein CheW [Thermodesulfovibrionales bacterium]
MAKGLVKGIQLVVFKIGKEYFGVGIDVIREIVRLPEVTDVPDAPDFLEGMINLRGKIVPVIDLKKRLKLQGGERGKATRVLVTDETDTLAGLIVDSVDEVIRIEPEAVEEPPEMMTAVGVEYITGVAKVDERLIILLDITKMLSAEEISKMANAAEGAEVLESTK